MIKLLRNFFPMNTLMKINKKFLKKMIYNKILTIKRTTQKLLIDKTMENWRDKTPR